MTVQKPTHRQRPYVNYLDSLFDEHNADNLRIDALVVGGGVPGAVGNGIADDRAAIQAAVDDLSEGGRLVIPAGIYQCSAPITINRPIVIEGASTSGANPAYGTRIRFTSGTTHGFVVNADHVTFSRLAIQCSATAASVTAARGIHIQTGNYCKITECRISGWWHGLDFEGGYGWAMRDNYIVNSVKYGIRIRDTSTGDGDAGDQILTGNQFDADMTTYVPDAAIRYESGGGLKLIGNKITHHVIGLDLQVADGAATSVLTVTGNSVENQTGSCIRLGRAGTTGTFSRINITGNQLTGSQCTAGVIRVSSAGISESAIGHNTIFANTSVVGIHVQGGNNLDIGSNQLTAALIGIHIESAATNVSAKANKFTSCSTLIVDSTALASRATVDHEYDYPFTNVTSTSTWKNTVRIGIQDRRAAEIEITVTGTVNSGVSGFAIHARRLIHQATAGGTLILTTIGTDVTVGPAVDYQFDVAGPAAGNVIFAMRRNAADGGTSLNGIATIRCRGSVERIVPQ